VGDRLRRRRGAPDRLLARPPQLAGSAHLFELIDVGNPNLRTWAGGGHSADDLFNFLDADGRMSAVVAQTGTGKRKIYLLLRPQTWTLKGSRRGVADDYQRRVLELVAHGASPIDASEQVLTSVSRATGIVLYTGLDDPHLARR
jgi:hypothetical protein